MSKIVRALQPLVVETWNHQQRLTEGRVEAGETFTLLSGRGYRTEVQSFRFRQDELLVRYGEPEDATPQQVRDAAKRLDSALSDRAKGNDPDVYGPLYEPVRAETAAAREESTELEAETESN